MSRPKRGRGDRSPTRLLCLAVGVVAMACAPRTPLEEAYPQLGAFVGDEIVSLRFVGPEPFATDTLLDLIETEPTHHSLIGLPIRIPGTQIGVQRRQLNLQTLNEDKEQLERFYQNSGYYDTEVLPFVEPQGDDEVRVTFVIDRGPAVVVQQLDITGSEGILHPDSLEHRLPLQRGELFNLPRYNASADTVLRVLRVRGHAFAEVLRNYTVDVSSGRADATLATVPGPAVVVDSIIVVGADRIGRGTILRQLDVGVGDPLRTEDLVESQRNLYNLELVQFATVALAEDTLQAAPDDRGLATVEVRVTEGPVHRVEAGVGYGTVECFRADAEWTNRNFRGGGRRLRLIASTSKVGVGGRVDAGAICRGFRDDDLFPGRPDFRLIADFTQPWVFSPRNQLTASLFAERQTAPRVFHREATGGRLAVARRLRSDDVVTAELDVQRARTIGSSAIFCFNFQICLPEDILELARLRWGNTIGMSYIRDRTRPAVDPVEGYTFRSSLAWSPRWLGSQVRFVRGIAETLAYRPVMGDWVTTFLGRVGVIAGPAGFDPRGDFLPPDERFYAGGAYSVRGFSHNELGPGVYVGESSTFNPDDVLFFPLGGKSVGIASVELRIPGPVAKGTLATVLFVDAGAVVADELWDMRPDDWRVTPGFGLRIATPVGPIRVDVGYNPYPPETAPLYLQDDDTGALIRVTDTFTPDPGSFLRRFRLHLAIGQPF